MSASTPELQERTLQPDPRTCTGTWLIAQGKHGKRKRDRVGRGHYPLWWLLAYYSAKAFLTAGCAGLGYWLVRRFLP